MMEFVISISITKNVASHYYLQRAASISSFRVSLHFFNWLITLWYGKLARMLSVSIFLKLVRVPGASLPSVAAFICCDSFLKNTKTSKIR